METILKSGYEKIIALYYGDACANIHLRNIARQTGLNENSATRFLKQLERQSILQSKKEGNLKKYFIQRNKKTFLVFTLFNLERYERLPKRTKNAIEYFIKIVDEKPVITVLFGSTAKGRYTRESDIDLLLIVNKRINTEKAEDYAEAQTAMKINCIQIKYNEFVQELKTKNDKVIQSAIKTGYPITNQILYYEEVLR